MRTVIVGLCLLLGHASLVGQGPSLDGTAWTLTSLTGHPAVRGVPTLRFEGGSLTGSDGCNSFRAPYVADASGVRLTGPMVATQRGCAPAVMAQAQAVQAAITGARGVRLDGASLVLLDQSGADLAAYASQSQDVTGTSWTVMSYNNGTQAVVSTVVGTTLSITFGEAGRLSGSAGCNRFTGTYTVSGNEVAITGVAATRRMCIKEGVMEQEGAFLKALPMGTRARLDGQRLELRTADGALAISAARAGGARCPSAFRPSSFALPPSPFVILNSEF